MKHLVRLCAMLAVLALVPASDARAQLTQISPDCSVFDGFVSSAGPVSYVGCAGAFSGNTHLYLGAIADLLVDWGLDPTFVGKTNGNTVGAGGPFEDFVGATTGRLEFVEPIAGVFVIALKAGNAFSLYHFDTGGATWGWLDYGTAGVSVNGNDRPRDLSNASLWVSPTRVVVPEPGALVLLLGGLATLGGVAWRRREQGDPSA